MNKEKQSGNSVNDQNPELSNSVENSSISSRNQAKENGTSRKRKAASSKGKAEESGSYSQMPTNSNKVIENDNDSNAKRKRLEECNFVEGSDMKEEKNKGGDDGKKEDQKPVEPLKDYIHVRARRGQATDSHSLAERVRREKIGERMKLLQDLVPGCNKVTGKALMLEEIINYVQSLQKQVEFLSMKLSNVDATLEMNMNNPLSKDGIQPNGCVPYPMYPPIIPTQYGKPQQNTLHDSTSTTGAMDPFTPTINHINHAFNLPPLDGFFNCLSQLPSLCEGDLQSIVQMGFGQKENGFQAQTLHGTNPTQMKIEF
ncbi:hypothetical protein KSS87_009984 [Heliosperma pusillum]|nr:hypothetical protein KSS87_009984 [Heliosperma pusillum]